MLPLLLSGAVVTGLLALDALLNRYSRPWNDNEEYREFERSREEQITDIWMMYR